MDYLPVVDIFFHPYFVMFLAFFLGSLILYDDHLENKNRDIKLDFDLDETIKNNCFDGDEQKMKEFYKRKF